MPTPPEPTLEALIDELAVLAAELWFEGKLTDDVPKREEEADGSEEA